MDSEWETLGGGGLLRGRLDVVRRVLRPSPPRSHSKGQRRRELGAGCTGCLLAECAWFFPLQINALSLLYMLLRAEGGRLPTSEDSKVEVGGAC